jgi:hypothetical protein
MPKDQTSIDSGWVICLKSNNSGGMYSGVEIEIFWQF